MLGGRRAALFRRTAMTTFARALAGDLSLAADIQRANCRLSGTPLQEALLEGTGVSPEEANRLRAEAAEALKAEEDLARRLEALAVSAAADLSNPVLRDAYRALSSAVLDQLSPLTSSESIASSTGFGAPGASSVSAASSTATASTGGGALAVRDPGFVDAMQVATLRQRTSRHELLVARLERDHTSLKNLRGNPVLRSKMLERVYATMLDELPPWWAAARAAEGRDAVVDEWTGVKPVSYGGGGLQFKSAADSRLFDRKVLAGMAPHMALEQCGGRVVDDGRMLATMAQSDWLKTHRLMSNWAY